MGNTQAGKTNWALVVLGVLMLLCGIGIYAWPGITLFVIAIWAGVAFVVSGVAALAAFITAGDGRPRSGWTLLSAAIDIVAGAVLLAHPFAGGAVISGMMGFIFLALGIVEVVGGVQLGRKTALSPVPMVFSGVLRALCGLLFVIWPASFGVFVAVFTLFRGVALILEGVMGRR